MPQLWIWSSGEFVKLRISNLQSLLACPMILWKCSLTGDDWIFGWLSGLASLILILFLSLTLFHCGWVKQLFCFGTPWIQFLRIRSWWRCMWIYKNVSRNAMRVPNAWRPFSAARHSYRTAWHSARILKVWKNAGWLVTWDYPLRTDSVSLKISRIIHAIDFIL